MGRYCCSSLERKLEDRSCSSSKKVLPEDRIDVGGLWVFLARVLLPVELPMVGIVESDDESLDALTSSLHIDQHSSAAVCQSIEGVHVVDKDNFSSNLQLEHSLKGCVLDAPSVVHLECLHRPACISGLDGDQLTVDLLQFAGVSGVHLGIGAIYVEGIVEDGVRLWTDSCLQQGDIFLCVSPDS